MLVVQWLILDSGSDSRSFFLVFTSLSRLDSVKRGRFDAES